LPPHIPVPVSPRPGHFPGPPGPAEIRQATRLQPSHLSPLPRAAALPPHHPARAADFSHAHPYPLWSAGVLDPDEREQAAVVTLANEHVSVLVDVGRGGRLVAIQDAAGAGFSAAPCVVANAAAPRGAGMEGGIEINPTGLPRSPWSLDPVHATTALPRTLGPRLRWWEYERAAGVVCQVDLHVPDGLAVLLVCVRRTPLRASDVPAGPPPRVLLDDVPWGVSGAPRGTGLALLADGAVAVAGGVALREEPGPGGSRVSWLALSPGPVAPEQAHALLPAALASCDDVATSAVSTSVGSAWAGVECSRAAQSGEPVSPALSALGIPSPGPADDVPSRHRAHVAEQWLHVLADQGLGTVDRVHPDDVGEPAGSHWLPQLTRAHRRESLGDWRVHLRLGELAFLSGRLQEARERWEWSNSLRPTPWADRNLALLDLATGDCNSAAVRYLRAHRRHPEDPELGVEAIGCLLAAGRATDCTVVLDRMALRAQDASARYWALKTEVALALGDPAAALRALESATVCADAVVQDPWLARLRSSA
jgi:hypothetical protein